MYGKSFRLTFLRSRLFISRCYSKRKDLFDVIENMSKKNPLSNDGIYQYDGKFKGKAVNSPSNVYVQVIGSGARGAPTSLYLFTDHNRYLFNCGESTQRLALEHKVKVSRLDHIFITNKSWRNLGGLPGLSITLQQVGLNEITVHGPVGIDVLYEATRGFAQMKDMYINIKKCSQNEEFEDNAITVKYIVLHSQKDHPKPDPANKKYKLNTHQKHLDEFVFDNTDYYNSRPNERKRKSPVSKVNKNTFGSRYILQKEVDPSHTTVAFACSLKKRLGTLNLEKCVELGVKPGPLLGKLKNGDDVTLPDGRVVKASDVKTPDDPGPVFIVLEVPDLTYLKESDFSDYYDTNHNKNNVPVLVVHFTPAHIISTTEYKSFMSRFGSSTKHLLVNELNCCMGSEAVHRMQYKLNLLDDKIFPLLKDVSMPSEWNNPTSEDNEPTSDRNDPTSEDNARTSEVNNPTSEDKDPTSEDNDPPSTKPNKAMVKYMKELQNVIVLAQFQSIVNTETRLAFERKSMATFGEHKLNIINGRSLTKFLLRPSRCLDRSSEPKLTVKTYIQEAFNMEGFNESIANMKSILKQLRENRTENVPEYPRVTFLGTGSSMPGKTRNVSSIAVHTQEDHTMLLDCGEGTYTQIWRLYGMKRANEFLRNLRAVYISHLHADHHIGLLGVLQARRRAFEEIHKPFTPIYLIAPGQIMSWLAIYDKFFESCLEDFELVANQDLLSSIISTVSPANIKSMGLSNIQTCYVSHCPNAFGVALYLKGGHKITYSGDTIPCQELVELGKDSTILLHEATIEDSLEYDARSKMHSTTSQAIEVGVKMNAKYTILTHFSQRYSRIPQFESIGRNVGLAYDYMDVSMGDLELLTHMQGPLQIMFSDYVEEMEHKSANRKRNMLQQMANSATGSIST